MGNKSSRVHQADVETGIGQISTTGELTQGTGVVGLSQDMQARIPVTVISTIPTAQSEQTIMAPTVGIFPLQDVPVYDPPPYSQDPIQPAVNTTYSQQHHQEEDKGCFSDCRWLFWILFALALPFIIAFFILIFLIWLVFFIYGIDLSKCVSS
ncbi:hypothetical protein CHS0354_037852 [Potamilus streckersoni]|uniref:Uncharacterized protein n=1 Tax=Potamilus streckersoni TaxID=2493646 RepID=A0AAE0SYV0_9BIVA|nr:hypothetical protein CHS0354_037852 [Potamilus streckersoni]